MPEAAILPGDVSRRGFLGRAAGVALAAFATIAGAPGLARARPEPAPCAIRCRPVSATGCACGGSLFRCHGCHRAFHACVERVPLEPFCLRRRC